MYTDSSFRIPAIYMNDSPDRYIHTNADTAAMIDPTKLRRAAFIAAGVRVGARESRRGSAPGGVAGNAAADRAARCRSDRASGMLPPEEALAATRFFLWHERTLVESMARFAVVPDR